MGKIIVFNDHISNVPVKQEEIEKLKKNNIQYKGADCSSEEDLIKYAGDADIIFNHGSNKITRRVIENLKKLRAILRRGSGYDNVDIKAAADYGKIVSNTPGFCTDEVATHTIAFILSFARRIPYYDAWVKYGKWEKILKAIKD